MMRDDVLQLAQDISNGLVDTATFDRFYQEVIFDTATLSELLVSATLLEHGTELANYDAPISTLRILGVFFDDMELSAVSQQELESASAHWRDDTGVPYAWTVETEGDKRFRVFPSPNQGSRIFSFPRGAPFGIDAPAAALGVFTAETRQDLPFWLELPVAVLVLAREFGRESEHRDQDFADACQALGTLLLQMVS